MPTRKQRRRRQKDLRHEYEYVYVDGEGHEVEVDPAELKLRPAPERQAQGEGRAGQGAGAASPSARCSRLRGARSLKRVAFIAPLLFLAFSALNHNQSLLDRLAITAIYTGFFVPFMYLMDRALYRSYLRRSGQAEAGRRSRKR